MATTALFIEILIVGSIANIWLFLIFLRVQLTQPITLISLEEISKLAPILIIPLIAFTYIIGWIVNYASEQILEPFFQTKFKTEFFSSEEFDYDELRATFYQKASSAIIEDINYDRQSIRLSRANVLNFSIIIVALAIHIQQNPIIVVTSIILSIIIAVISFVHWQKQYKRAYKKMLDTFMVIKKSDI